MQNGEADIHYNHQDIGHFTNSPHLSPDLQVLFKISYLVRADLIVNWWEPDCKWCVLKIIEALFVAPFHKALPAGSGRKIRRWSARIKRIHINNLDCLSRRRFVGLRVQRIFIHTVEAMYSALCLPNWLQSIKLTKNMALHFTSYRTFLPTNYSNYFLQMSHSLER